MSGPGELSVGDEVRVEVGPVAHGGHCVARYEGRVLFVRHALPGETVVARVTEGKEGDRFVRADAVSVVAASAHRVEPPCPYAGPGRCGGCDFQHVALDYQRSLKEVVVREQLTRLAHLDLDALGLPLTVEPVPGDLDGLAWRTRVEFAVDGSGRAGLRAHRSHDVVPVERCAIALERVNASGVLQEDWSSTDAVAVDVLAPGVGETVVVPVGPGGDTGDEPVPFVTEIVHTGASFEQLEVSARGFWQVHPGAASTFVGTVLEMLDPQPGERAVDLYAGVGLFALALALAVGPTGQVIAVESDPVAVLSARTNLADHAHTLVVQSRVHDAFGAARRKPPGARRRGAAPRKASRLPWLPESADLVVLDPPRTGAGRQVLEAVTGLRPRVVVYVACDPATLARDTAYLADLGYVLSGLRAYDAFPMTHHVECVARFVPAPAVPSVDLIS